MAGSSGTSAAGRLSLGNSPGMFVPNKFGNIDELLLLCEKMECEGGIIPAISLLEAVAKR
jgi:hypothetical protein